MPKIVFRVCFFFVREKQIFCSLYCVFSIVRLKKWRGCENESIFPFISQNIILFCYIFSLGYRNSNLVLYVNFTVLISRSTETFRKYEMASVKPFTSIIRKPHLLVLYREHPEVLARDKLSTLFSNDNLRCHAFV